MSYICSDCDLSQDIIKRLNAQCDDLRAQLKAALAAPASQPVTDKQRERHTEKCCDYTPCACLRACLCVCHTEAALGVAPKTDDPQAASPEPAGKLSSVLCPKCGAWFDPCAAQEGVTDGDCSECGFDCPVHGFEPQAQRTVSKPFHATPGAPYNITSAAVEDVKPLCGLRHAIHFGSVLICKREKGHSGACALLPLKELNCHCDDPDWIHGK